MTRLWDEEMKENSRILRLSTLERLGGAQEIVRTHLEGVMGRLDTNEREVCARFFDRLVTPSGSKIAYTVDDLTNFGGNLAEYLPSVIKNYPMPVYCAASLRPQTSRDMRFFMTYWL